MFTQKFTENVSKPVETVWQWLSDPKNTLKLEAAEIDLTEVPVPPLRVGSRWAGNMNLGEQKLFTVCELTELDHNKTMGFRIWNDAFKIKGAYHFEIVSPSVTKMTTFVEAEVLGAFKPMESAFAEEFERESKTEFAAIKKEIEAMP